MYIIMSNLSEYKKLRVDFLTKKYNSTLSAFTYNCNLAIIKIQKMRTSTQYKKTLINKVILDYNNYKTSLLNKLNSDIAFINNLKPEVITILNKYALLIGSNYPGTNYQLSGCVNDINFLKDKLSNTYGFNKFTLITDDLSVKPTRTNILASFKDFLSQSKSGDFLFFGFSGHGTYVRDTNGDETDGQDETIVSCDLQNIKDDELKQIIVENLKPNATLFCVFDSCHSGSVLDLKYQYLDSTNYNSYNQNDKQLETNGNVIMISGCMDSQTSEDAYINRVSRGAMIWSFLETINKTPNINYFDLLTNMRTILKNSGYSQIPQLSSGKIMDMTQVIKF